MQIRDSKMGTGATMKAIEERRGAGNALRVELKYCECCGGLWVRWKECVQVYCVRCVREMDKHPPVLREVEAGNTFDGNGERWDEAGRKRKDGDGLDLQATGGGA